MLLNKWLEVLAHLDIWQNDCYELYKSIRSIESMIVITFP